MDFRLEQEYAEKLIAGVDEVGRGPLAGPVVAAAVIADQNKLIPGIKDSKKLSKKKREELYAEITKNYIWSVGIISPKTIDQINILEATKRAMYIAVNNLSVIPSVVLADGNMKFDDQRFISIIKGDDKSISIAAASIVAKVTRDQIMSDLSIKFPAYKWCKNSGYGTKEHINSIISYGATEHHRQSFLSKIIIVL
jgi:ribonuclease HII